MSWYVICEQNWRHHPTFSFVNKPAAQELLNPAALNMPNFHFKQTLWTEAAEEAMCFSRWEEAAYVVGPLTDRRHEVLIVEENEIIARVFRQ